jgi:DNA-binding CsgD family transcriptional regulator
MAYKIALLGATDQQLAEVFDVSERTINVGKNNIKSLIQP